MPGAPRGRCYGLLCTATCSVAHATPTPTGTGAEQKANFLSGGYSEFLTGLVMGRLTARGPLNVAANTQFTIGNTFNSSLAIGSNYAVTFSVVLTRVSPSTAVDQAAMVEIEGRTSGSFTTTFSAS